MPEPDPRPSEASPDTREILARAIGLIYEAKPADRRRIMTVYGFIGDAFRKDLPLVGNVEVTYAPDKGRVVYQPVTIEPRTLVPKVIRDDGQYSAAPGAEARDA